MRVYEDAADLDEGFSGGVGGVGRDCGVYEMSFKFFVGLGPRMGAEKSLQISFGHFSRTGIRS